MRHLILACTDWANKIMSSGTVNSEIFARDLLWRNFALLSFVKIKSSRNGEITLSFVNMTKSCPSHEFLTSQICLLMLFAKISESTVQKFVISNCDTLQRILYNDTVK